VAAAVVAVAVFVGGSRAETEAEAD
jgi:hypothetical protein